MPRALRTPNPAWIIALLAAILLAVVYWSGWRRPTAPEATSRSAPLAALAVASSVVDRANEGWRVHLAGLLKIGKPARDVQLGVSADAIALLRNVQMFQWQEHCENGACEYTTGWSDRAVDSRAFHDSKGHANPGAFPFASARFLAGELRLGAFDVDPELAAAAGKPVPWPVHAAQLPPNLAATFSTSDGVLYAGGGPDRPRVGDLRVSYRVVPAGEVSLTGIQQGDRLQAPGAGSR